MKLIPRFRTFVHSIRFRLVMWFIFILTLVLIAFSAFIYYNQGRDIRGDSLYRLGSKLDDIEDALRGNPKPTSILQPTDVFILFNSDGKGLVQHGISSSEDALTLMENAQAAQQGQKESPPQLQTWWIQDWRGDSQPNESRKYIFIARPIPIEGNSGLVVLGSPYDPYGLNNRLLITLIFGSLLTIAIALAGGLWLADRAMRPVHTITKAALTISETDLNHRLNMTGKDELAELANTFDAMLSRLQAAFERQRQFVADARHELRTSLTIVNLEASRALNSSRSPNEYQRVLGVIRSENELMTHLVNDLLTLARMDSGQLVIDKSRIDLSDVALDVLERLSPLAERKGVRLLAGDLPEAVIMGDRQYLIQMLSNLVENGIKYSTGEDRQVQVETGLEGGYAWVRVSNSGVGIPPEHLPYLFNRFYRVDKARSREEADQSGGTGLGLSIVDWIVRALDGEVQVKSSPDTETIFEVKFKSIS